MTTWRALSELSNLLNWFVAFRTKEEHRGVELLRWLPMLEGVSVMLGRLALSGPYLINGESQMVVSQTLLHERYQSLTLDVRSKGQILGVDLPVALEFNGSIAITCKAAQLEACLALNPKHATYQLLEDICGGQVS